MNVSPQDETERQVAEAVVSGRPRLSVVWLVPLIAIVAGAWLVYKARQEQGPIIEIHFKASAGVVAEKTPVKYRDVEIGKVEVVRLNEGLDGVVVVAALMPGSERLLGANARFWIEQPEISLSGVRGLQTIFSGVFIAVDPDTSDRGRRVSSFTGLEDPPLVTKERAGRTFVLEAEGRSSLGRGAPVLYRDFKVGQVIHHELVAQGRVEISIFVEAPYDAYVTNRTRFWNASGVDVEVSTEGIRLRSKSLSSIIAGGVEFDALTDGPAAVPAEEGARFDLFGDRDTAFKPHYRKRRMVAFFDESVRGLSVGAPVEFRGARLGEVADIRAQFSATDFTFRIPVYVDIETERLEILGEFDAAADASRRSDGLDNLQRLVDGGLRAQLKTGSLLTGQKLIALELYRDAEPVKVRTVDGYNVIPTVPTVLDTVTQQISSILEKLERLPLEEIAEDMRGTVARVRQLVERSDVEGAIATLTRTLAESEQLVVTLRRDLVPQVDATLSEAQTFAHGLNTGLEPKLEETLIELKDAARAIRVMSEFLERHPDALIKGKP